MIYLLISIICSTMVFVVMKIAGKYEIDNHQTILFNYCIAAGLGIALCGDNTTSISTIATADWFPMSLFTGFWFILSYIYYAICSKQAGVTITAISGKMSVVLPILYGLIFLNESINVYSSLGIIMALLALYFSAQQDSSSKNQDNSNHKRFLILPLLVFFVNGLGDIFMKICENLNNDSDIKLMTAFIYSVALIFALLLVGFELLTGRKKFNYKSIYLGIALGLVNYFSTLFMFKCMTIFDNVFLFPVYNIGIVTLSALLGMLIFRERLNKTNYIGLVISIIAVILISLNIN